MVWPVSRVDFDSAFVKNDSNTRDIYVCPPKESGYRVKFYWLLLVSSYKLENTNSNWKSCVTIVCLTTDFDNYERYLYFSI